MQDIDNNYLIKVAPLMYFELPKPSKKLYDIDGKQIPIIWVNTWD